MPDLLKFKSLEIPRLPTGAEPADIHWSLSSTTPCGIVAFNRPCQYCPEIDAQNLAPMLPICKPYIEKVLVVEDDDDLREELVDIIRIHGHDVVGLPNATEFNQISREIESGCILLDIRLPGRDGVSILESFYERESALSVVILSGLPDPLVAAKCMKLGAFDFLAKPFREIDLIRTINEAISKSRMEFCRRQSKELIIRLLEKLTPAERKVAELLAKGYPTKWIAGELQRSENTIKIHRHRIMAKLKVSTPASVSNIVNYLNQTF